MKAHCPSCSRYIGPEDTCPYCQDTRLRTPGLRLATRWMIPAAALSVLIMLQTATSRPLPEVSGAELSPLMNHARVDLCATVRYRTQVRTEPVDSVYLPLESDGHLIRAKAYNGPARELMPMVRSLKRGDRIRATGSLSFSAGRDPVLYVDRLERAVTTPEG